MVIATQRYHFMACCIHCTYQFMGLPSSSEVTFFFHMGKFLPFLITMILFHWLLSVGTATVFHQLNEITSVSHSID